MASVKRVTAAERAFWQEKCKQSFWWFFKHCWGYDYNPKGGMAPVPWMMDTLHRQMADWFEFHAKDWMRMRMLGLAKPKKIIAVVPRDFGKTTLLTAAGQTWLHVHDPDLATYTGCDTIPRAREILSTIKTVISGQDTYSNFVDLYGMQESDDRKWKIDGVVTAARKNLTRRDDSFGIWAVETGMVGLHPDGGFFDDPNTYERMARYAQWLDIVNNHFATLIPVFQKDAFWCLTATRYGDGDHVGTILQNEGCASMTGMQMPDVQVHSGGQWHVFFLDAETEDGQCTMPTIWPRERIETFKAHNIVRYYAQVRNNPRRSPYKLLTEDAIRNMVIQPLAPADLKRLRVSLHFDTAFKSPKRQARADKNVIAAVGHEPKTGRCIFLGARTGQDWTDKTFATELLEMYREWTGRSAGVFAMTDEEEIGGKPGLWPAFLETAFKLQGLRMPPLHVIRRRTAQSKEDRLLEVAPLWSAGKMSLIAGAPGLDDLVEQMGNIGLTKYDDVADAVGDCFNKDLYKIMWAGHKTLASAPAENPFDDVLKPGRAGIDAAEKIAAAYAKAEQQFHGAYDAVHP